VITLDVGCGNRKMGDVNVDKRREVNPDVICDIHFLPFKDKQFDMVYCYHVLEHEGVNPLLALEELKRVCNGTLEIQVPHWLSPNAKRDKTHVNFQVMRRRFWTQFKDFQINLDYVKMFPTPLVFVMRPNNITIKLKETQTVHDYSRSEKA
jgi:predicted SAM-dependent methyltransferase